MKKAIALVLTLAVLCCSVLALAESESRVYYLETLTMEGVSYNAAEIGFNMTFTFNADGTGCEEMSDEVEEFTWIQQDEETIVIIMDEEEISFKNVDGKLVGGDDETEMVLSAEAPEAISFGEMIPAEGLEAFNGEWECQYVSMEGMNLPLSMLGSDLSTLFGEGATSSIVINDGKVSLFGGEEKEASFENGVLNLSENDEVSLTLSLTDAGYLMFDMAGIGFYCTPVVK